MAASFAFDVKESLQNMKESLPEPISTYEFTMNIMISIGIGGLTIFLVLWYLWSKKEHPLPAAVLDHIPIIGRSRPRFRKRDKVVFYGRKMLRKVKSFTRNTMKDVARNRLKKRQVVMKLARKFLYLKKDQTPTLQMKEPPPSFLEADWPESTSETRLPPEVMYMLRSVKVLGHFDKPIFLELCKYMESRFVPAGSYVFQVGDTDDSIYVVQSGEINLFINEPDGTSYQVKEVGRGDSIHSLLSILDVLTGHAAKYKTVSAVAQVDSIILRLPILAFHYVLEKYPETLVRVIQIIMVRLQRVTFMALHNYLGLSSELINPESQSDKSLSIHNITLAKHTPLKSEDQWQASPGGTDMDATLVSQGSSRSTNREYRLRRNIYSSGPGRTVSDAQDIRQRSNSNSRSDIPAKACRSMSAPTGPGADLDAVPSEDFMAACSRARVEMTGSYEDNPILTGSPPVKSSVENLFLKEMDVSRGHKSVSSDHEESFQLEPSQSNEDILELATHDIAKLLCIEDEKLLLGRLFLRYVPRHRHLITQGEQDAMLIFVVTGSLQVLQQAVGKENEERSLFIVHPGEFVGSLAVLTGEPSFFTIRARTEARVVTISKHDFYSIMKEQPKVVINVAHTVSKRMSAFVRQIDFALDWMQIEAGRALFKQTDHSDSIFIVLNGRLRSVVTQQDGKRELVGEYGRGELVGIVEVLTQSDRATTIIAVRDTELAQIPEELLNMIKCKYPQIVTRLIHLLGQRILGSLQNKPSVTSALSEHPNAEPRSPVANLATVAVVAVNEDIPLTNFTMELQHALNAIGPTLRLTSEIIQTRLGASALDSMNEYRLSSWLGQQEDIHRMVLYQCDYRMTPWTQRCMRQADCILIVAKFDAGPTVGKIEKQMENLSVRAQKELILLHNADADTPRGTVEWLNARGWCTSHHHLRCPKRVFSKKSSAKSMEMYRKLFETEPDRKSDFSRLSRLLTGTSIGLVLGGGGARGIAHIGLVRAMQEAGIPIDIVGGTSIGAFMGALWCQHTNITPFTQKAREWSMDMTSLWKKIVDLTYPVTAMFSGKAFNKGIENVFKEVQIEDLWVPYFCITTDITASKMRVHTSGSLWRYVRASMSLSGYLPPLCDPVDGHLLLDGGYVNNLPADVMKTMGAQKIFAINVGSQDDTYLTNYGDELSGWWLLWAKWYPWAKPIRVPDMTEIQSRLAYVSGVRQLEQVKSSNMCEYIRPPIDKYRTLQFGSFDEIHDVGYHHGKTLLSAWMKKDILNEMFKEDPEGRLQPLLHRSTVPRDANFTDLAELISRIDEPHMRHKEKFFFPNSDDEYEDEEEISVTSEPSLQTLAAPKSKRATSEGNTPSTTPTDDVFPEEPVLVHRRGTFEGMEGVPEALDD